jgi:iron complex outermembrane receptor protein
MLSRFSSKRASAHPLVLRPIVQGIRQWHAPFRLLMIAGLCLSTFAHATDDNADDAAATKQAAKAPKQLEEVEVQGTSNHSAQTQTQTPTQADLNITQPQSVIGLDWISNHVAPTADYATIAAIAPGVTNVSPAGPGLGESKQMTLRGFNDNQYNVTYDGIPFGDTNDFSHHTSSYFPAKMIGQIVVDRGPGNASTIGDATFGGTVALNSKDPLGSFAFIPTQSFGSYDTRPSAATPCSRDFIAKRPAAAKAMAWGFPSCNARPACITHRSSCSTRRSARG